MWCIDFFLNLLHLFRFLEYTVRRSRPGEEQNCRRLFLHSSPPFPISLMSRPWHAMMIHCSNCHHQFNFRPIWSKTRKSELSEFVWIFKKYILYRTNIWAYEYFNITLSFSNSGREIQAVNSLHLYPWTLNRKIIF